MQVVDGFRKPTVTEKGIYGFFGPYRWLSNYENCYVEVDNIVYSSSEAAYMAQKTLDVDIKKQFSRMSASDAKKFGQTIQLRPDWEAYKVLAMTKCLFSKFYQNDDLRLKLIDTGKLYLEETNDWNDKFWGVCNGEGTNMLGHILMYVRDIAQS